MRARLVAVLLLGLAATASAQAQIVIEDWSSYPVGPIGVPTGWTKQNWGSPQYNFAIATNGNQKVLHMKSTNDGSTISKDIKGKVNLKDMPLLEWSWKATILPKGGDACKKGTDDQAAQIYVTWPRFPTAVRSRIIGYVWDTTAPAGTICKSEKTGTVTYIIVRSGSADLGKWFTERRNVMEDFRKIYGEEPENPEALSVAIDSNDTNSTAESMMGTILFRRP